MFLLMKTTEEESRFKHQIQNQVPATIDHTNIAFQSGLEMFVGVDPCWCHFVTFPFTCFPNLILPRRDYKKSTSLIADIRQKKSAKKKNSGWFLRAKFKVVKDACEARRTVGSLKMSVGSLKMSVKHDELWEA
jgi:hypothetical protein